MTDAVAGRVLIGGVGYRHLRDYSIGVVVSDQLGLRDWPSHVEVDDLSFNPVAVSQRLVDEAAAEVPIDRLILVGAVERGKPPGTVTAYRWDGRLPDSEAVQAAVTEAVTGVINLDNTLVVVGQFGGLPETVVAIEVEPAIEEFGEAFSRPVQACFSEVCDLVTEVAMEPDAADRLPRRALGGAPAPGIGIE